MTVDLLIDDSGDDYRLMAETLQQGMAGAVSGLADRRTGRDTTGRPTGR
jgi:hypothetical protein